MIRKILAAGTLLLSLAGTAQAQYYYPTASYPVYAAPAPVYATAPVYYSQPAYAQPVYQQPVYAAPVYAQPVYAQPYAYGYGGGYYSPLSIGLNFGFGGGRHWR